MEAVVKLYACGCGYVGETDTRVTKVVAEGVFVAQNRRVGTRRDIGEASFGQVVGTKVAVVGGTATAILKTIEVVLLAVGGSACKRAHGYFIACGIVYPFYFVGRRGCLGYVLYLIKRRIAVRAIIETSITS